MLTKSKQKCEFIKDGGVVRPTPPPLWKVAERLCFRIDLTSYRFYKFHKHFF